MISGVRIKKLHLIPDERGALMEMLRDDDELFIKFGQVYITSVYPGVVKGWHYHKIQTDNFVAVKGMIKLVLYDNRQDSPTRGEVKELFIGEKNRLLVQIPPHILHGFKGVGLDEAFIINIPTEPYDRENPDEYRIDPHQNDIPYDWAAKDG
jgi:dTDP-4-dehydrorhamnose 3,5-epimerase